MDRGVCYTYKAAAFPRYRFFQEHLQRLVERWQQILDAASLPDCISQGRAKLKEIVSLAQQIDDNVTVNVFAEAEFLETRMTEVQLQSNKNVAGEMRVTNWTDFTQQARRSKEPTVTVIALKSQDENEVKDVNERLSRLPKDDLGNFIIYFTETKISVPYSELVKTEFQQQDESGSKSESKAEDQVKPLNKQVQDILEEKAVSVLDRIAGYNKALVPKKQDDDTETLQDAVFLKLIKSLGNSFVVKDLSPEGSDKTDEIERKPTDKELSRIAEAVGRNWEMLGPSLGMSSTKIDEIKHEHEGQIQQIYHMLLSWRQNEGSTLRYLLQLLENASAVITVDIAVIKDIEKSAPAPKTDRDKDEIFHKNLLEFVTKKTKCVACDKFSQRYGMSANLINEFLNEGFFGYEKRVEDLFANMSLPSWPRDKSDDGVKTCKTFSYRCGVNMMKLCRDTEDYIQAKLRILMILKRLQFQLFGLLEDTNVAIDANILEIPKLPTDLQHALLDMPEVYGCGTIWGDLEIHLNEEIVPFKKAEISNLLTKHMYMNGCTMKMIASESEDAGGFSRIEHGSGIRAKRINSDEEHKYKYGSLGCFVHVKQQSDEAIHAGSTNYKLQGLTCAHCVRDCEPRIEIKHEEKYVELGEKEHDIYEPHSFDVAMVDIDKSQSNKFEISLKNGNKECVKTWKFHEKPAVRTPVYKYGCATGLTHGTCISVDYRRKVIKKINAGLENKSDHFHPDYTILISREDIQEDLHIEGINVEPEARPTDEPEEMEVDNRVTLFSQAGDSGSVVCKDGPDNDESVQVISLLMGTVKTSEETYSYSGNIHKSVQELQKRYNCIIEPACEDSDGRLI